MNAWTILWFVCLEQCMKRIPWKQTCSLATTCRESSHSLGSPQGAPGPWSTWRPHEHCMRFLRGRTRPSPSQSTEAVASRGQSWHCEAWHPGAWCPWSDRSPGLWVALWCRSGCRSLRALGTESWSLCCWHTQRSGPASWTAGLWQCPAAEWCWCRLLKWSPVSLHSSQPALCLSLSHEGWETITKAHLRGSGGSWPLAWSSSSWWAWGPWWCTWTSWGCWNPGRPQSTCPGPPSWWSRSGPAGCWWCMRLQHGFIRERLTSTGSGGRRSPSTPWAAGSWPGRSVSQWKRPLAAALVLNFGKFFSFFLKKKVLLKLCLLSLFVLA